MILLGLGANLPSPAGSPEHTLHAALDAIAAHDIRLTAVAPFYRTAPVPVSDQPWFVNSVAAVETVRAPRELLGVLHAIEEKFGRMRRDAQKEKNSARTLDLDILDWHGKIIHEDDLVLPHPRMHERAFVLIPLRAIAPGWRHPVTGAPLDKLIDALDARQDIVRL